MDNRVIPVYVIDGFLDAGKTTFIRKLLGDEEFSQGERVLLLACEDGMEKYDEDFLTEHNVELIRISKQDELTEDQMGSFFGTEVPAAIVIEWNGMWDIRNTIVNCPDSWRLVMIISVVDGTTYEIFSRNMGNNMYRHISKADAVEINRCTPAIKEMLYRKNLIAMNPKADIEMVDTDGNVEVYETPMPDSIDMSADTIDIPPEAYGFWYIDAMRKPAKYDGKRLRLTGEVRTLDGGSEKMLGRMAMVCCADDITFYGIKCEGLEDQGSGEWLTITGDVSVKSLPVYKGEGPVLRVFESSRAEAPEDKTVYLV